MLSREVAQNIVSRTMEILNYNINVMDNNGVIIGSGDKHRIGTIHEVAKQIQIKRDSIEISIEDEQEWNGVKQGINLPIYFHGEVMGTVGITGEPSEVRRYGELVKMTAEMIIEQSFLLKQIQYDERIKREFVYQWITGKGLSDSMFLEKAKTLEIDLLLKRGVVLINERIKDNDHPVKSLDKLEKALSPLLHKEDVMSIINEYIVIIKHADSKKNLTNVVEQWASYFDRKDLIFTSGYLYEDYMAITYSYEQAMNTLEVSKKLELIEQVLKYEDRTIEVLLNRLLKDDTTKMAFPIENPLPDTKGNRDLLNTLDVYITNNCQVNKTAKELFVHRNTLTYRLDKIRTITGKDPRKMIDLFYLYCMCQLKNKLQ
ncbi:transcriptional regulator [Salipaludibacillus keqinensis]|uniref:Transcriptional regulator n=1 Tax=Salipaludibacillus keqinensis TaxID=2045207 RepID=A0A323T9U1_9BACI|nr:sugar diacid recognition domain-containing protein [Salipaludibacillus keqinensis]PYZ92318.1 transcriptional regulator [Salipaludibacillus keqinensis]